MIYVAIALLLLAAPALAQESGERAEQLAKERVKLQREKDPVDQAKIGIKISEILLASVGDSIQTGDFGRMQQHLNEYTTTIEHAHQTLVDSGRDAQKKASGFKELEIALRKHVLRFEDLGRALTLDRRQDLEKVKSLAAAIQKRVFKALFP